MEGEGLVSYGVCCAAGVGLVPVVVGSRVGVVFVRGGEDAGKEDGEDGFDAGEAAADYAEVHFEGHEGVDRRCIPWKQCVSGRTSVTAVCCAVSHNRSVLLK